MLQVVPTIVGMFAAFVVILGFVLTFWRARRSGVLTGGDLPKGVRIERSADPDRFNQYLRDRVRLMALPIGLAASAILIGFLSLAIALVSGGG